MCTAWRGWWLQRRKFWREHHHAMPIDVWNVLRRLAPPRAKPNELSYADTNKISNGISNAKPNELSYARALAPDGVLCYTQRQLRDLLRHVDMRWHVLLVSQQRHQVPGG
jgi:hypothetical protein